MSRKDPPVGPLLAFIRSDFGRGHRAGFQLGTIVSALIMIAVFIAKGWRP